MRVLIIGASGNFGRRLARLMARDGGFTIIAAGRRQSTLDNVAAELACETLALNRETITAHTLRSANIDLLIDVSGPFQTSDTRVIKAAIEAGVHYVDIADGRAFVSNITSFDAAAKAAGVVVIAGASSTPALSDAAASHITAGWQSIDTLRVVISPSNRQPRGIAVIAAILTYVGQPLRIFRQGAWRMSYGWGDTRRVTLPHVGRRWASLCDTPDLDQLVARHNPRVEASFYASLELSVMHLGLMLLSWFVRIGFIKSLSPLASPLNWIAGWLEPFGNDRGGMTVEASGHGHDDLPCRALWWLAAKGHSGPNVPILGTLGIARLLRDNCLSWRGAAPCTGILTLASFKADFTALGIQTGLRSQPSQLGTSINPKDS